MKRIYQAGHDRIIDMSGSCDSTDYMMAVDPTAIELRALLAAPVVERQPNVIDLDAVDWETIQKAADESSWMPNEYMRNEWVSDVCNLLKYGRAEHPAPPELAELQATIAKQEAEINRLNARLKAAGDQQ